MEDDREGSYDKTGVSNAAGETGQLELHHQTGPLGCVSHFLEKVFPLDCCVTMRIAGWSLRSVVIVAILFSRSKHSVVHVP